MKRRNYSASRPALSNIDGALAALNAEDLGHLIRIIIPRLDDRARSWFTNAIIEQASRGRAEWQPSGPTDEVAAEVLAFAEAAKRTGYADPSKIDDHLQEGSNAFLARNYRAAIRIFHALLIPLSEGEIDLGQDEMFEEVLGVNTADCAARYAVAVYMTSAPDQRAGAVFTAIEDMGEVGIFLKPLQELERVAVEPLPDFDIFLPKWRALMEEAVKGALKKRAAAAIEVCPEKEHRQKAFLHVLLGNCESAAKLLASAPGLGWSDSEHPGHLLFPIFCRLRSCR